MRFLVRNMLSKFSSFEGVKSRVRGLFRDPFHDHALPMMAFVWVAGLIGLSSLFSFQLVKRPFVCLNPHLQGHLLYCTDHEGDSDGTLPPEELGTVQWLLGNRLDLNEARARDLVQLPRIGPAMAKRILDERSRTGGFCDPGDLIRVKGIGPRTLERIQPFVAASCNASAPRVLQQVAP